MTGLVLEGGGAKGAFHIGSYKALTDLGLKFDGVTGTSIGALNGAMIVQKEIDRAYDLWYNISPSRVFNVDEDYLNELRNFSFNKDNIIYLLRKARVIMNNRGLDVSNIKKLLEENIKEEKIRAAEMDFGIVTISLSDMKPLELFIEDIPPGKLVEYLMASANLPAFKLEKLDGKLFIDGGFYDNLPIHLLKRKGYKKIVAVRTFGMGVTRNISEEELNITYINPSEYLGRALDFDRERVRKNLKLGYYDTLRVYNDLKGDRYYIRTENDDKHYLNFFLNLNQETVKKVGRYLNLDNLPYRRAILEEIVPMLVNLLNVKKDSCYEDIVIAMCEKMAERLNIERFKVYGGKEFLDIVRKEISDREIEFNNKIAQIIKKYDFLSKPLRNSIIEEIIYLILMDK